MSLNVRTTICINMLVLMIAAIVLISMVIFRVSEHEIRMHQEQTADLVFTSVAAALGTAVRDSGTLPQAAADLNTYLDLLATEMDCDIIVFSDRNARLIARAGPAADQSGLHIRDTVIGRARTHSLQRDSHGVARHVVSGPVMSGTQVIGYLKIGFPADRSNRHISSATRMILMYMVLVAVIIFSFGMFLLSRYVVRPIRRLTLDMQVLAGGLLPESRAPESGNEIERLSTTIKTLYNELKQEQQNTAVQLKEIKAKNRQLEQARHEILQSEKMASVGRLAAGIAHEIGNPAGIVTGYLHMLKQGDIGDEQREDFLARMEHEVERISATIRDLLTFAQPSSGQTAPVQINDIIRECIGLFDYQGDSGSCSVSFEPGGNLPEIQADPRMLQQLIVNLMLNARDAMPAGGTIRISTRAGADRRTIELAIADTGCGIAPEHQNLIFEPFFTTKDPGKGTGLGLSNALRIVELYGGTISAASTPGQGTEFTITFAARTEPAQP